MIERTASIICAVVERPDHHCGEVITLFSFAMEPLVPDTRSMFSDGTTEYSISTNSVFGHPCLAFRICNSVYIVLSAIVISSALFLLSFVHVTYFIA